MGLSKPSGSTPGGPVDPASAGGILVDPESELAGTPLLDEVIKGDGLGGWTIGLAPFGPTRKELILVREQLLDGAAGAVLQAILAKMNTNPTATDTFVITDGTTTETFTFQAGASAGFNVQIQGSATLTQAELVARINAVSTLWSAVECGALDDYFAPAATDPQFVVHRTANSSASDRIYGTLTAPAGIQVVAFDAVSNYETGTQSDLPAADPAVKRFGFSRAFAGLVQNEAHTIACDNSSFIWDGVDQTWQALNTSAPDATESARGLAELATQVEANAETDDLRIITPLKLASIPRLPTQPENDAQVGTSGAPSSANPYRTNDDPIFARVPDTRIKESKVGEDWKIQVPVDKADDPLSGKPNKIFLADDTIEEGWGIGGLDRVPASAGFITIDTTFGALAAPAAASTAGGFFYVKEFLDNAPPGGLGLGWTVGTRLADRAIPTDTDWHSIQETFTLAAVGLTAGRRFRWQQTRVLPLAGTNLLGDLKIPETGVTLRFH